MTIATVDYYDTLVGRNGGLQSSERFARLFMEPTVYHCGGGYEKAVQPDLILPIGGGGRGRYARRG